MPGPAFDMPEGHPRPRSIGVHLDRTARRAAAWRPTGRQRNGLHKGSIRAQVGLRGDRAERAGSTPRQRRARPGLPLSSTRPQGFHSKEWNTCGQICTLKS